MGEGKITVGDAGICITDVDVRSKEVADFFRTKDDSTWEETLTQVIQIGVFCLERAQTTQDTEFVRRQIEGLLNDVERAVTEIPLATEKALVDKIGSGEGQVLAPIDRLVRQASDALTERIKDVRELLANDIDPAKETTTLGKALKILKDLLDPNRTDSVQLTLKSAVADVTSGSGTLAAAVEASAKRAVQPLVERVEGLAKEIHGEEEVAAALAQTTVKGATYEEEVVSRLQRWATHTGAEVQHVGTDNKAGDVLVNVLGQPGGTGTRIIVEARDRGAPKGRKAITNDLTSAMAERGATAAVYVSKTTSGLANEIGDWAEGRTTAGRFIACLDDHLVTAVRFIVAWERLSGLMAAAPEVDAATIQCELTHVRTALAGITNISRKVSDVRSGADAIQTEAERIRDEIRAALCRIEDALRVVLEDDEMTELSK